MRMILKKFLYEQITCDKFITTELNKHVNIMQSHNQSIKNFKITLTWISKLQVQFIERLATLLILCFHFNCDS